MIGAVGTTATCSVQGFAIQLGFATPLYNAMLCVYFLTAVGFPHLQLKWIFMLEYVFHTIPLGFGLCTAIYGASNRFFNSNGSFCWLESFPYNCSWNLWTGCKHLDQGAMKMQLYFAIIPISIAFATAVISLGAMCFILWRQQRKRSTLRSIQVGRHEREQALSLRVFVQAMLYAGVFFITFVPLFAELQLRYRDKEPDWLHILYRAIFPLQGFWNFFIFVRQTYIRLRKRYADQSSWLVFLMAMKQESVDYVPSDQGRARRMMRLASAMKASTMSSEDNGSPNFLSRFPSSNSIDQLDGPSSQHSRRFIPKGTMKHQSGKHAECHPNAEALNTRRAYESETNIHSKADEVFAPSDLECCSEESPHSDRMETISDHQN